MFLTKGLLSPNFKLLTFLLIISIGGVFLRNRSLFQNINYDILPIDLAVSLGEGITPEAQYLARLKREYKLTNETEWLAWRIRHSQRDADWTPVNDAHQKFGSQKSKLVYTEQPNPADLKVTNMMQLPISSGARSQRPNASDFMFGIATTYARVVDQDSALLRSWARWLTKGEKHSNGASLVVMLDRAKDDEVREIESFLRASGIDAQVTSNEEPISMARRYHELAKLLKSFGAILSNSGGQIKRWFALVEDDVFFPDISYLQDRLAPYKTTKQLYLGMPSEKEDWDRLEENQVTTYGGGAVFLTRSALSTLSRLACFNMPVRRDRFRAKRWDILLQEYDIDAYETGVRPLILHRGMERHGIDINMAHLVTNVCGDVCFMQRYLFHDNWVFVNGVSISQHFDGLKHHHTHEAKAKGNAPKRSGIPKQIVIDDNGVDRTALTWTANRKTWQFADSVMSDDGAVWQAYVNKDTGPPGPDNVDSVIVLVWENVHQQQ